MESSLPPSSQPTEGCPMKTMLIEAVKGQVPKFVWQTRALGITSELPFLIVKTTLLLFQLKINVAHNFNKEHESENVFSIRLYKHTLMRYHKIHHIKGWFPARYIS